MDQDRLFLLGDQNIPQNATASVSTTYDTLPNSEENQGRSQHKSQYVAAVTATLSALAAGAALGWTSPILNDIQKGHFHHINVTDAQTGWIGSLITVGALCTCLPAGAICDLIGPKSALLALVFLFGGVGWSLIIYAGNVAMLYCGRLLTGMGVGACCVAAPLYVSEIAQKEVRGRLGSYFQLMVNVGILYAYATGVLLDVNAYTIGCGLCVGVFAVLFAFRPETPVYFVKKGKFDKAKESLAKLRGKNCDIDEELRRIEYDVKESTENAISFYQTLKRKATIKAIIIATGLMFFQQFSGINVIILYSSDVFSETGSKLDPRVACIAVASFQVIATFASSLVIDKLGRRKLLLLSDFGMALSSFLLGFYFTLKYHKLVSAATLSAIGFVPIVALCVFVVLFSVGFGPIPWMISGEIFVPQVRSTAGSFAGALNWFLAFVITRFYIDVKNAIGEDTTFYMFGAFSCLGTLFVYFVVPETKGKSVEEIQTELAA